MSFRTSLSFNRIVLTNALFGLATFCAFAQDGPKMEWGEIDPHDLQMKSYPADTNASAVVLFDHGEAEFNNDVGFTLKRHERIKILSKAGYDWATITTFLKTAESEEEISGIEGITYALAPDGSIHKTGMDADAIFKEDVDKKFTRYSFTLPALQPGCVVEFRYVIRQKHIFSSPDWEFQTSIPIIWSEFQLVIPKNFAYAIVSQGYESFRVSSQTDETRYFSGDIGALVGRGIVKCTCFRFALQDAPAVREESFMTTPSDYKQKVSFQLSEYSTPYTSGIERVLKTWEMTVKELMDDHQVGKAIGDTKAVRRVTEPLLVNLMTPEEKLETIYNFVRTNMVWSGKHRWVSEREVDDVLESHTGSSAEITTLLLSMLRVAGIEGFPVLASTRDNGRVQDVYPILSQFNYSLACVPMAGKMYFLDATDRFCPFGVLPARVLNTRGLLLREGPVEWVSLATRASYNHAMTATVILAATGELHGQIESIDNDYAAIARRKDLKDEKDAEMAKNMLGADKSLIEVDSIRVTGRDSVILPLVIQARINSPAYAQVEGDLIYFNPFVVERQCDNPFTLPVRRYPVDMTYPRELSWNYSITLPEGYDVKEVPEDKSAVVGGGEAVFTRTCKVEGRSLSMHAGLVVHQSVFPAKTYGALKGFYEKITSIEGDQVVLRKRLIKVAKGK